MQPTEYLANTAALHSSLTRAFARFQHLADVNTPPNYYEISELRSIISESRSLLSNLTVMNMLVETKETVESLTLRIDQITFILNSAKKITHPLRSLPNEILCLIFAHCIDYDERERNSLSVDQAPWTVSYVCRSWRHLVTSCPFLWSTPCFDFTAYGTDRRLYQHAVYLLTLYIDRTSALPLDVTLRVMSDCIGHISFRHILQATSGQWKSALLDLPLSEILLLFQGCTFPLLKSVSFRDCLNDIEEEEDIDMFSSLPLLQSIAITTESWLTPQSILMPWSQIVEYNYEHNMFSTDNLDVLRQMTSLRYLVAYVVVGLTLEAVEPLVLPLLTHLKLSVAGATESDGINLSAYLAFLRMPLLNDLTLNYSKRDALCPVSSHPNFLSVKTLRVHLNLVSTNSNNFVHFLSLMGGVEELELSGVNISDQVLQALTPTDDGILVLPRLRVLDTHNAVYALALDPDPNPHILAFHNMLLSRSRAHKRLVFTLEKLIAAPTWRSGNHRAVVFREEVSMRWEQVCAMISVSYVDADFLSGEGSEYVVTEDLVDFVEGQDWDDWE